MFGFSRRIIFVAAFLITAIAFPAFGSGVRTGIPLSDGNIMPGFLFFPSRPTGQPLPAVITAVGVGSQLIPQYHDHCRHLAERGFAVLLIDPSNYPESLVPSPYNWDRGMGYINGSVNQAVVAAKLAVSDKWYLQGIRAAVDHMCRMPGIDSTRLVLAGFSQPANAVLTYASRDRRIKALVWNYGGSPWVMPYEPLVLPPVLIFHGDKDDVYDVKYARSLAFDLHTNMRSYELHIYPGQKHMFNVYYDLHTENRYCRPVVQDSFEKLISFLVRVLNLVPADKRASKKPHQPALFWR